MRAPEILSVNQRVRELVNLVRQNGPKYYDMKRIRIEHFEPTGTQTPAPGEVSEAIQYMHPDTGEGTIFLSRLETQVSLIASHFVNHDGEPRLDTELLKDYKSKSGSPDLNELVDLALALTSKLNLDTIRDDALVELKDCLDSGTDCNAVSQSEFSAMVSIGRLRNGIIEKALKVN